MNDIASNDRCIYDFASKQLHCSTNKFSIKQINRKNISDIVVQHHVTLAVINVELSREVPINYEPASVLLVAFHQRTSFLWEDEIEAYCN